MSKEDCSKSEIRRVAIQEEELKGLRTRLKCGEYDGTDIMKARLLIDELIDRRNQINLNAELKAENKRLLLILEKAKEKIECYTDKFGLAYPGGMPVNILLSEIQRELNNTVGKNKP